MADKLDTGLAILDLIRIAENQTFLLISERNQIAKAKDTLKPLIDAALAEARGVHG